MPTAAPTVVPTPRPACFCTKIYRPVFCSNGKKYMNQCEANCDSAMLCALTAAPTPAPTPAQCLCPHGAATSGAACPAL